jgi:hypothetical protein
MLPEMGVKFSASCTSNRFVTETKSLQSRKPSDTPGESETIYNSKTEELFTYHFDTQKGVGKKYNLSHGLIRSTDKYRVKEFVEHIRGYEYFKIVFFFLNRARHDRSWSHNRGGGRRGLNSDSECHQDY